MTGTLPLAAVALLGLFLGLVLLLAGQGVRRRRGLGGGMTVSLDRVTFTSRRHGLTGRPDRIIRSGGLVIVEEWKSARRVRPSHWAQMGVYFLLVEDQWGVVPSYGVIVLGDGRRQRIDNSEDLRAWVLGMASQVRLSDGRIDQPIEVNPFPGLCRPCGMREHCSQARG